MCLWYRNAKCTGSDASRLSITHTVCRAIRHVQEVHATEHSSPWPTTVLQGVLRIFLVTSCIFSSRTFHSVCWQISYLSNTDCLLQVGSSQIQPSTVVRDLSLSLHLDSELSMKQHITKVAAACLYHLRRLHQICRRVGTEVMIRLVLAVVMSCWLLQFITGRFAAVDAGTVTTSAECHGLPGLRA